MGPTVDRSDEALSPLALQLLASLHRRYNSRRLELLAARERRQAELDGGMFPTLLPSTAAIRSADWRIEPVPMDLQDRCVEITGPVDRKVIINALNAPARSFIADFEDSLSPTWENVLQGQVNLADAVRRTISYLDSSTGNVCRLNERTATLLVRPRGWHLPEKHVRINGEPVSGALFDFALFVANNHDALARQGTAPYFYLPKIESHQEARLWRDVFVATESVLDMRRGTIKATVLIETIFAAFEMDEILYELREHATGLNFGRWDYIFSFIKKFRNRPEFLLPDRDRMTMDRPFLKSCVNLLIKTCHRRGAHAMGGMAAQIPIRDNLEARTEVEVAPLDLLQVPDGDITEAGLRNCIRVGVQYLEAWLRGSGCVPIDHLMEDAATAEICRAQLWQCVRHGVRTDDGQFMTVERFDRLMQEELGRIEREVGAAPGVSDRFQAAARLLAQMVTKDAFDEFLTLPAYELLA